MTPASSNLDAAVSPACGRKVRVKICGVTRIEDALRAVELGADFLGLNFYPPSPRCLAIDAARRIADAVRGRTRLVGVVVNPRPGRVEALFDRVGLDLVQFHGDETPRQVEPWAARAIRAFRWRGHGQVPDPVPWEGAWGWLFDYHEEGRYGGTGRSWNYEGIAGLGEGRRLFVAGGVGPDNARHAVAASDAWALDVCSGVESAPGIKDEGLLERLFDEVRDEI